jgi:hypothetical protein
MPTTQTNCGPVLGCVDLQTDPANCGVCGNQCDPGATCTAGGCTCTAGQIDCGGTVGCRNISTDPNHCGSCNGPNHQCIPGDTCVAGVCTCPMGEITCAGLGGQVCTTPATDPANCNACGHACEQGDTCVAGVCTCPTGSMMCGAGPIGTVCADLGNDPDHCGACGTACTPAQACLSSACTCRPGLTLCNGTCVDLAADGGNCGACGNACDFGGGQRCVDGVCKATFCGALTPPRNNCNGSCVTNAYFQTSPIHCGSCNGNGHACNADQVCVAGACTDFFTSAACTSSPCPACGTGTVTCKYPGTTSDYICVTGNTCPQ